MNDDPAHIERLRADLIRRARIERHGEIDVPQSPRFPSLSRRPFLKLFRRGKPSPPARNAYRIDVESPKSPDDEESRGIRGLWSRSNSTRSHTGSRPEMSQWNGSVTVPSSVATTRRTRYDDHESRSMRDTVSQRRGPGRARSEHEPAYTSRHQAARRPKRFLGCFPWVKSKRLRRQILVCFVSGLILICLIAVYLGLSKVTNVSPSEMTIMLVLVILFATIFFFYGIFRLSITLIRGSREVTAETTRAPKPYGHRGYAVPPHPIPVVLAQDEEAAGVESAAAKLNPPAYGIWRESVRVDPNRLFWQRNESADPIPPRSPTRNGPRPPSYASDDGVSYVVEARPRSMAPSTEFTFPASHNSLLPHPHPMDVGRAA